MSLEVIFENNSIQIFETDFNLVFWFAGSKNVTLFETKLGKKKDKPS